MEERQRYISLEGSWQAELADGSKYEMHLPGTLDENGIGTPQEASAGRFRRKHAYEGMAKLTRRIDFVPPEGKRVFLEAERARCLSLLVDGKEVQPFSETSLSTPYVFELTGLLAGGNELTLLSDNSYPGLPHDAIIYSSAATDETQTNWNGVLGYLRLRMEEGVFVSNLRVYPKGKTAKVIAEVSADRDWEGNIVVESEAFAGRSLQKRAALPKGIHEVIFEEVALCRDVRPWDEEEGNLYEVNASLNGQAAKVRFGVRDFGAKGGRLTLNDRVIFLRSEANCAVFPETGYPPMDVESWIGILKTYRGYGINCLRFHSHCPPEAAFAAADRLGMLMQPELSHWNPKDAFESDESFAYYGRELRAILRTYADHPSFVMLTFGNELQAGALGHERMDSLLEMAHALDTTRLFANGSNVHYGAIGCDGASDFYASQKYFDMDLRGTFAGEKDRPGLGGYINNRYPGAQDCYDETMKEIRKNWQKPVFSFEVGQFEVLPDFGELEDFHGISEPDNYRKIQERVKERGLEVVWKKMVEATGELSLLSYREEVEAALRTQELSGISLLGLQDFPGQGTALVGMLNSHLQAKPYDFARPERFRAFFQEKLVLALLPRYTWEAGEALRAKIKVANYGKQEISGELRWELYAEAGQAERDGTGAAQALCGRLNAANSPASDEVTASGNRTSDAGTASGNQASAAVIASGSLGTIRAAAGCLTDSGILEIRFPAFQKAQRFTLHLWAGSAENSYPLWVYPKADPVCPPSVYETEQFDERAREVLRAGGSVYLTPPSTKEALPQSIQGQFTTDFWSVGTFPAQEGGMGQLIDADHPVFRDFPTEFHTDWQWWPMAMQRAVILPENLRAIVAELDSYATLRPMAQLLECRCGGGKLLFSSFGLQDLQQYPEARALLASLYRYMDSEDFCPGQEIGAEVFKKLVACLC